MSCDVTTALLSLMTVARSALIFGGYVSHRDAPDVRLPERSVYYPYGRFPHLP